MPRLAPGTNGWISGHEDGSISMNAVSEQLPGSIDAVGIVDSNDCVIDEVDESFDNDYW